MRQVIKGWYIILHAENWAVPKQLLVQAAKATNNITSLPYGTLLLDIRSTTLDQVNIVEKSGLRLYALPDALVSCGARIFKNSPTDVRVALSMISGASEVLGPLLEGGHSHVAGRLAGAFRSVGQDQIADDIADTMRAAGYDVRETDPFESETPLIISTTEQSPYVNRIRLMWQEMRDTVMAAFSPMSSQPSDIKAYMQHVEDVYATDAYHSLSIEGYRVTPELIQRVRSGDWNLEQD